MTDESPIASVANDLFTAAAKKGTWSQALRFLALAATDDNVEAFRLRAVDAGLDLSHLRWRGRWEEITADELRVAVDSSSTYVEILERLGYKPGGRTYRRLEALCADRGIVLPALRPRWPGDDFVGSVDDEAVRTAFPQSRSMADLLRRVGLVPKGDNYRVMRKRLARLGLDPKQLKGKRWAAGQTLSRPSLEELLRPGKKCDGPKLAQRLVDAGLLQRQCATCLSSEWLAEPIPLELDHINGEHDDNRLENLRLLCPNCHALTPTYRGRNVRARRARRLGDASPGGEIR